MKSFRLKSSMLNKSGLKPLGQAVLVKPFEPAIKKGRIELPGSVIERYATLEQRVVVIEVGPEAWKNEGFRLFGILLWRRPRAVPGDKVMVSKYGGQVVKSPLDGETYRMINGNDFYAKLLDEEVTPEEIPDEPEEEQVA